MPRTPATLVIAALFCLSAISSAPLGCARQAQDKKAEGQKPEPQKPEVQKPEVQKPEAQKPEAQKPEVQKPEGQKPEAQKPEVQKPEGQEAESKKTTEPTVADRVESYAKFRLTTDLTKLSDDERKMIPLLIEAAKQMDKIFWMEAYGEGQELLSSISDPATRRFAAINYGPWDRLGDHKPFVPGVQAKPPGANFYPPDMTKQDFEQYLLKHPEQAKALKSLYTMVRRDKDGGLKAIPYHEFFKEPTQIAARKLEQAAAIAKDPGLKKYLTLRARALLTDEYQESDLAWLDMKNNGIDIVIGPIETYEDRLFGYKAAHEAYVLVKDKDWSKKLAKYIEYLPDLQRSLPTEEQFKAEEPGLDSDLSVYDVIYYAGDCNAGAKTIAINLPNDEKIQLEKGTRRLQLKNVMRAKFDKILLLIAKELISERQLKHVTFEAFFANTMFHEVAHGLGIKNTITGLGTVREALKDQASAMEEAKADVLGLFMIAQLREQNVITEGDIRDNSATFFASIFRSARFGASSAHGRANILRYNFFKHLGAFGRVRKTGKYLINLDIFPDVVEALAGTILLLQGQGNYRSVENLMSELGQIDSQLRSNLERLQKAGIPVDIVFEQGMSVLQ